MDENVPRPSNPAPGDFGMCFPILQRNPLHCLPEDQQLVKHGGLRLLVGHEGF